ncbi:MAG: hypothetical protein JW922_08955, partial [Paludibacteraceae bacterium]|nr:hypothetical protein [Paludibacteraceae bacterium]
IAETKPAELYLSGNTTPSTVPAAGGTYYIYVNNSGTQTLSWNVSNINGVSVSPIENVNGGTNKKISIIIPANTGTTTKNYNIRFYNTILR